jgi:DNA/RNA-binding domain of Phe-tRNA-synthetase-like protein
MFTIDENIVTAFPGTKMGLLLINGVSCSHSYEESETAADLSQLHQKYAHLSRKELKAFYPIQNYVSYYKSFGYSYPVLAQLESVLKGKKTLYTESALLQAMFLSELDGMLLTGGHDLAKLQLPLHLKAATGTEVYQSISGKEVTTINGDMMLCDSSGILSSILRGPDYKSRITASTTEVLFSIYAPPTIDSNDLEINLQKLEKRIKTFSPSSKTVLLQVFS